MKELSLSVIIPAYNEEKKLSQTLNEVLSALEGILKDYEILIVDDASTDRTGVIADNLSKKIPRVKAFHNKKNGGLGYSFKRGLREAQNEYVIFFPGDNSFPKESIKKILHEMGKADIIIPYHTNLSTRPLSRQIISYAFTFLINTLFGLRLRYYNSTVLYKRSVLASIPIDTDSFAFQAEALVKLLRMGYTYKEVGISIKEEKERKKRSSSAFKLDNITGVFTALARLWWYVYTKQK